VDDGIAQVRRQRVRVEQERREWREWRFRWGTEDRDRLERDKEKLREEGMIFA